MPSSISHVIVLTDDFDGVLRFLADVAGLPSPPTLYETEPDVIEDIFGWPAEHGRTRAAFVGNGPGSIDLLEIPSGLRDGVKPRIVLPAIPNRDVAATGEKAAAAGYAVRGPFAAKTSTGGDMAMIEVTVGGIGFELVQFG